MEQPRPAFNVCVFCGSSPGVRPEYAGAAKQLGRALARKGLGLVYGGASVGIMGEVADACLEAGGYVEGVIPEGLFAKEVAHAGLSRLFVVESMHARKALMAARADAFVALPGGFGTLEELFEVTTWSQLGIHARPIALLDVGGYYEGLLRFIDHAVNEGFISTAHRQRLSSHQDIDTMLEALQHSVTPAPARRWIDAAET